MLLLLRPLPASLPGTSGSTGSTHQLPPPSPTPLSSSSPLCSQHPCLVHLDLLDQPAGLCDPRPARQRDEHQRVGHACRRRDGRERAAVRCTGAAGAPESRLPDADLVRTAGQLVCVGRRAEGQEVEREWGGW